MNNNNNNDDDEEETAVEPFAVSIATASRMSGESKSQIYCLIQDGELEAVKSRRKTLVIVASIKRRLAGLPKVTITRKRRTPRGTV